MIIHCQTCKADTILREGQETCSWCGTKPARLDQPRPEHPRGPTPYKIREPDVIEAWRLYSTGLSVRQVAAIIYPRTDYASERSCAIALDGQFRIRGWQLRPHGEATIAANKARAISGGLLPGEAKAEYRRRMKRELDRYQPMCGAIVKTPGPRRGEKCGHPAVRGSDFCVAHDPARKARRDAVCAEMRRVANLSRAERSDAAVARAQRCLELLSEGLTRDQVAAEVGCSPKSVHTLASRARKRLAAIA